MSDSNSNTATPVPTISLNPTSIRKAFAACDAEATTVGSYDDIGGNKIYVFRLKVTPESAEQLLAAHRNPHNRNVLKSNVAKIVADMNEGRWEDNGDPLVMDANLQFKNGHHRMTALAQSSATITFTCMVGVGSDLFDVGKPRTIKDQMKMIGVDDAIAKKTPALMIVWYLLQGRSDTRVRFTGSFSNAQVIEGTEEYHDTVTALYDVVSGPDNRHIARPQVIGALAFAVKDNADLACKFLEEVRDMENLAKGSPVLWIGKKLGSIPNTMTGTQRELLALDVLYAYKTYCDNDTIKGSGSLGVKLAAYDSFAK